jgi:hypothetical protein
MILTGHTEVNNKEVIPVFCQYSSIFLDPQTNYSVGNTSRITKQREKPNISSKMSSKDFYKNGIPTFVQIWRKH